MKLCGGNTYPWNNVALVEGLAESVTGQMVNRFGTDVCHNLCLCSLSSKAAVNHRRMN